jgi:phosphatidylglycerophosphate synthase
MEAEMTPSIADLRIICQKPVESHDSYSLSLIYRRISIYITKIFLFTSITANQVTLMSLVIGLIAAVILALGHYSLGALIYLFSMVMDCVDGEIARYRNSSSIKGVYLDIITHYINTPALFMGLSIGIYRSTQNPIIILLGSISAICIMLVRVFRDSKIVAPLQIKTKINEGNDLKKTQPLVIRDANNQKIFAIMDKFKNLTPYASDNVSVLILLLSIGGFLSPAIDTPQILGYLLDFYALTFPLVCIVVVSYFYKIL